MPLIPYFEDLRPNSDDLLLVFDEPDLFLENNSLNPAKPPGVPVDFSFLERFDFSITFTSSLT
jgi:hypothetical protein